MARKKRGSNNTITAAGITIDAGRLTRPDALSKRMEEWQNRVTSLVKVVPEAQFAGLFVRNVLKQVRLYSDSGDKNTDAIVDEILAGIPKGRLAENLFFVGEAASVLSMSDKEYNWYSLGSQDYKVSRGAISYYDGLSQTGSMTPLSNGDLFLKYWRASFDDVRKPYSTFQGAIDVLESLYLHQLADRVVAASRIAGAGILYIPNDDMQSIPVLGNERPEPGTQQEVQVLLEDSMNDTLRNLSEVEDSVKPLVLFGPAEYASGLRHLVLDRADDARGFAIRMQGLSERFARSIDLPPEIVLGMTQANHWASWKVDQNTWKYHLKPLLQVVTDRVEDALNNALVRAKVIQPGTRIHIQYDANDVLVKPDKTDAAIRLYALGAITSEAACFYAGIDEKYATGQIINKGMERNGAQSFTEEDGKVVMPGANYRTSEGEPNGARSFNE